MGFVIFTLFIAISCSSFVEKRLFDKTRVNVFLLLGLVMALVAGLRPDDIDHDYMTYVEMYENSFAIDTEVTFLLIASFVEVLFNDVVGVFVIYAFISLFVHLAGVKKLTSLWFLSLLVYVSNYYLLHEMNQIRVGVAAAFFLVALYHLGEGNRRKYLLYALFATLFHYTACVLFLFAFLMASPSSGGNIIFISL